MREVHVMVIVPQDTLALRAEDIFVQHEPKENYEGNDPNSTRITAREGDTEVIIHWQNGIPQDKEVETHATDAVLRSLGL